MTDVRDQLGAFYQNVPKDKRVRVCGYGPKDEREDYLQDGALKMMANGVSPSEVGRGIEAQLRQKAREAGRLAKSKAKSRKERESHFQTLEVAEGNEAEEWHNLCLSLEKLHEKGLVGSEECQIILGVLQGKGINEIANELGIHRNTVRNRTKGLRALLKKHIITPVGSFFTSLFARQAEASSCYIAKTSLVVVSAAIAVCAWEGAAHLILPPHLSNSTKQKPGLITQADTHKKLTSTRKTNHDGSMPLVRLVPSKKPKVNKNNPQNQPPRKREPKMNRKLIKKVATAAVASSMALASGTSAKAQKGQNSYSAKIVKKISGGQYIHANAVFDTRRQKMHLRVKFRNHNFFGFCGSVYVYVFGAKDKIIYDAHQAPSGACVTGATTGKQERVFFTNGVKTYQVSNKATQEARRQGVKIGIVVARGGGKNPVDRLCSNVKHLCSRFKIPKACSYIKKCGK